MPCRLAVISGARVRISQRVNSENRLTGECDTRQTGTRADRRPHSDRLGREEMPGALNLLVHRPLNSPVQRTTG